MSALDLFVAMAVVAAVAFSLMADPRHLDSPTPVSRPVRALRSRWRAPAGFALCGDLLFVQRLGARTLGLDCLLAAPGAEEGSGSPIHVRARCSVTWWAAERFMELVETWAGGEDPARVELVPYAGSLRARITHRDSCLILDVVATEDLSAVVSAARAA